MAKRGIKWEKKGEGKEREEGTRTEDGTTPAPSPNRWFCQFTILFHSQSTPSTGDACAPLSARSSLCPCLDQTLAQHNIQLHLSQSSTSHIQDRYAALVFIHQCRLQEEQKRRILKKVLFSTLYSTERDKKKASGFEKDNTVFGSFKSNTNFCFQHKLINEMCEICSVVCT